MTLEQLRRIEAISRKLVKAIPPSHPEALEILRAPSKVCEAMDSALELAKMQAVAEYINTQPEDRQDLKTLSKMEGPTKICKRRLDAVGALEKQLVGISVKYNIETEAKVAGAINPSLVADYIDKTTELKHSIDDDGNVNAFVNGRSVSSFIKNMTLMDDTSHLFDGRQATKEPEASQECTTRNPWAKETFNLTQQGEIYQRDPILAEKLQKAANLPSPSPGDNPWKDGSLNLTEQGRILRGDPNAARRMIIEAGKVPQAYGL